MKSCASEGRDRRENLEFVKGVMRGVEGLVNDIKVMNYYHGVDQEDYARGKKDYNESYDLLTQGFGRFGNADAAYDSSLVDVVGRGSARDEEDAKHALVYHKITGRSQLVQISRNNDFIVNPLGINKGKAAQSINIV
jgi:hypothetical protein